MVAEESRRHKPYALPIQFLQIGTLRDHTVRNITKPVEQNLIDAGVVVVGMYIFYHNLSTTVFTTLTWF